MKQNSMRELDFEQTMAFDSVEEFEFTRRAAQRFRQVVRLDQFEDEDADVIFNYLYKEIELVSFGDYLKRYIYERAGLEEPFYEVPQEVYKEIVTESFKETYTPKSMNPTSTKLSSLINNWLTQASVKRETVFLLGFGLRMTPEDVSEFLTKVLREQDFDFHSPEEVIYWYCFFKQYGYSKAEEYKTRYMELDPNKNYKDAFKVYSGGLCLDSDEKLFQYLAYLKVGADDPMSEESQAFQECLRLLQHTKEIIASMYQQDENEKNPKKIWTADDITPADVEKVICSGIPVNQMGNLKKMSASILAKHFSQKRFSRQRITSILNHKLPVERFDLITLQFFIISQEMQDDDPYNRYHHFLEEIQEVLQKCGMSEIYIVNPYECFLLMCLLTDCPLAVFADIWEMSYEDSDDE
ncbi:MAG: hypothetical protein KBT01_03580 [Clostridiales bacterium]|nr:hypothetical protein [Candidatus Blautia equi]